MNYRRPAVNPRRQIMNPRQPQRRAPVPRPPDVIKPQKTDPYYVHVNDMIKSDFDAVIPVGVEKNNPQVEFISKFGKTRQDMENHYAELLEKSQPPAQQGTGNIINPWKK